MRILDKFFLKRLFHSLTRKAKTYTDYKILMVFYHKISDIEAGLCEPTEILQQIITHGQYLLDHIDVDTFLEWENLQKHLMKKFNEKDKS